LIAERSVQNKHLKKVDCNVEHYHNSQIKLTKFCNLDPERE